MHAEVISIGDELTSGQRLDTNSQWLSQRLGELGIRVLYHTTVGDDLEANINVFRNAIDRANVILCTGGLGPTADDLTRHALADATQRPLQLDEESLTHIRNLFARRGREMPPANEIQAWFPAGSRVVPNPHGSAPGIDLQPTGSVRLFALPGVPAEMREMWESTVRPVLQEMSGGTVIAHRRVKCFGVGESDLEQMLPDLIRRGRKPSVGITVSQATITLRVTAEDHSEEACRRQMQPTIATIHECLGDLIFGEEDDELHHAIVRMLANRRQTLATAEIGSSGLLADWLGDVGSRNGTFRGGLVLSTFDSLGQPIVASDTLSEDADGGVARTMALAARHQFGADFGLALGPYPDEHAPSQDIHLAVASPAGVSVRRHLFAGHPDILRHRSVKQTLDFLRETMLSMPVE